MWLRLKYHLARLIQAICELSIGIVVFLVDGLLLLLAMLIFIDIGRLLPLNLCGQVFGQPLNLEVLLPLSGFGALGELRVFLTPPLRLLLVVLLAGQDAIVNGLGRSLTQDHLVFGIVIKALGRRVLELKCLGSHRDVILLSVCLAFAEEGLI